MSEPSYGESMGNEAIASARFCLLRVWLPMKFNKVLGANAISEVTVLAGYYPNGKAIVQDCAILFFCSTLFDHFYKASPIFRGHRSCRRQPRTSLRETVLTRTMRQHVVTWPLPDE